MSDHLSVEQTILLIDHLNRHTSGYGICKNKHVLQMHSTDVKLTTEYY